MNLSVLISCMHQKDATIIQRSKVRTDAVIVNQCNENDVQNIDIASSDGNTKKALFISTTERGLSRSRNLAIQNANTDICLIMDDDEELEANYESIILGAYEQYKDVDVIVFKIRNSGKDYRTDTCKVGFIDALKVASWEITFKRKSIVEHGIKFNVNIGSGTKHGSGEENAFLWECLKKGLKIQYVPQYVAALDPQSESQWFKGFTERFFLERGWSTSQYMGKTIAFLYAWYYAIRKRNLYKNDCSFWTAIKSMITGIFKSDI